VNTQNLKTGDVSTLQERLEKLQIVVSKTDVGFTVSSYCEPLFCFDAPTELDINDLVVDTLRSYIETFYHVKNVKFKLMHYRAIRALKEDML
jgi:hypothetical protein